MHWKLLDENYVFRPKQITWNSSATTNQWVKQLSKAIVHTKQNKQTTKQTNNKTTKTHLLLCKDKLKTIKQQNNNNNNNNNNKHIYYYYNNNKTQKTIKITIITNGKVTYTTLTGILIFIDDQNHLIKIQIGDQIVLELNQAKGKILSFL